MDAFDAPEQPKFRIRELDFDRFVIDVHWPHGSVEQLVGVFVSREHAALWLLNGGAQTI